MHVKTFNAPGSIGYALTGLEYSNNGDYIYHFPLWDNAPAGNYAGRAWGFYPGPPPVLSTTGGVVAVCGNLIVEQGEACDGGECCSNTCTFKPSNSVCRAATGFCDEVEFCTGSSVTCPNDVFKAANTPCDENFGVCSVSTARTCTGNSGLCTGIDFPVLDSSVVQWFGYTIISFGEFNAESGSVGGRVAVKGDTHITGGFSVGSEIIQIPQALSPIPSKSNYLFFSWRTFSCLVTRNSSTKCRN